MNTELIMYKLLIETNNDIKSICYDSGFNNFSNFIRFLEDTMV